jgi:hypothetical protein
MVVRPVERSKWSAPSPIQWWRTGKHSVAGLTRPSKAPTIAPPVYGHVWDAPAIRHSFLWRREACSSALPRGAHLGSLSNAPSSHQLALVQLWDRLPGWRRSALPGGSVRPCGAEGKCIAFRCAAVREVPYSVGCGREPARATQCRTQE